jgi:hypothetical protein
MKNRKEFHLTVQSCGSKEPKRYRLGMNVDISKPFKRGEWIVINNFEVKTEKYRVSCGCPPDNVERIGCKKGYDIYSVELSKWIMDNNYHCYLVGIPTQVFFNYLNREGDTHYIEFIEKIEKNTPCN